MISLAACALCALLALLLWSAVGLAVARHVLPDQDHGVAPALGFALFTAAALPLFDRIGLTANSARLVIGLAILVSFAAIRRGARPMPALPLWMFLPAALLAMIPALAVLPKIGPDGTSFAIQIFDHSKAALIDEIARSGVPPINPFAGAPGAADGLAYYYLWHFAAGMVAAATGATGWEADAGLTWATAFASLTLMMAVAARWSGKRTAAGWVLLLSFAVSMRPILTRTIWGDDFGGWITGYPGLQDWLVQASWVPQHLASANCVCLTLLLLARLGVKTAPWSSLILALCLSLVVAAGFESSTYIGGILLGIALLPLACFCLMTPERWRVAILAVLAAAITLLLILPFVRDQYAATAARGAGFPVAVSPFEVFGPRIPRDWSQWLDIPGFWLVQLPVDLPAISIIGLWSLLTLHPAAQIAAQLPLEHRLFAIVTLVGLLIAWLLQSTIANNDLGWRALLPAVMGLTLFTALFLARTGRRRPLLWLAMAPAVIGLFGGAIYLGENFRGDYRRIDPNFAASQAMWAAVRRHSSALERVANNPGAYGRITVWPVNLSWALLADRRSCFAGHELALAYVAWPRAKIDATAQLFDRVFSGTASSAEVHAIGTDYDCRVVLLTALDPAWNDDPFAKDPSFHLVEEDPDHWRVYRLNFH
jgi:hypothetical protein